jgi:hypothetical protein
MNCPYHRIHILIQQGQDFLLSSREWDLSAPEHLALNSSILYSIDL